MDRKQTDLVGIKTPPPQVFLNLNVLINDSPLVDATGRGAVCVFSRTSVMIASLLRHFRAT